MGLFVHLCFYTGPTALTVGDCLLGSSWLCGRRLCCSFSIGKSSEQDRVQHLSLVPVS